MDRTIHILSDHTFLPDRAGGRESSIHDLACALHQRGRKVQVIAREGKMRERVIRFLSGNFKPPYLLRRVRDPIAWACTEPAAGDIVIANLDNRNVRRFTKLFVGTLGYIYFRDAQNLDELPSDEIKQRFIVLANSEFLAGELSARCGLRAHIFPPVILGERYRVSESGRYVTFVNPVPKKGLQIALAIAKLLPEIPFQFVEAWPLSAKAWKELKKLCAPLKNVSLLRRCDDMREIYKNTRVLLVPSLWEEGWGRVVTEAQFSGIPSIVSNSGALPKVAGRGGVVIDRLAPPDVWAMAVNSAYLDGDTRERLKAGARAEANTYSRLVDSILQRLINLLDSDEKNAPQEIQIFNTG